MSGLAEGYQHNSSSSADVENDEDSPEIYTPGSGNAASKVPPPSDKTISCVSCRKRKLKCDRVKPKCGTCTRLRHDCEFPERKRNLGSKRRNMKELEARLAQVETQLVAETKMGATMETVSGTDNESFPAIQPLGAFSTEPGWNAMGMDLDINLDMGVGGAMDPAFGMPQAGFNWQNPSGDFLSQELIALGLQEPLPPQDTMDELNSLYFETFHKTLPIIHKYRYYASLDRAPHMRPPVCLRYAMWAMAASVSENYTWFEDILYERARRYIQQDEMKGHGEAFISVYYVQAWAIIAAYEALKTYFSRSWMSSGRTVRLVHMLGLHRLDGDSTDSKRILPPPRDWIELEERRRAFWAAFHVDRWASSGTGWPMIIDEREILTNLPASEDAFENGIRQDTVSLEESLTPAGAAKATPFGGIILAAALFGHNFQHLHRIGPNERPDDLANGEFWKRHRKMDNVLSNTFMFLPDHLRLPQGLRDVNVPIIHLSIHTSAICLHQAAILTAEKHKLDINFKRQCRARSVTAAEEVVNIMRMVSHIDVSQLNSWTGFCLYVAAGVLVQDKKLDPSRSSSLINLDFLLSAMRALAKRHSITNHFIAQLELDIEASNIRNSDARPLGSHRGYKFPMNGILAERDGSSGIEDLVGVEVVLGQSHCLPDPRGDSESYHKISHAHLISLPASSRDPPTAPDKSQPWNSNSSGMPPSLQPRFFQNSSITNGLSTGAATLSNDSPSNPGDLTDSYPYNEVVDKTPSSDSSTPNTTQYAIRPAPHTEGFPFNASTFTEPSTQWKPNYWPNPGFRSRSEGDSLDAFLENQMWGLKE